MSTYRVKDTECRPCRWKVYDSASPVERNEGFYADYAEAVKEADRRNCMTTPPLAPDSDIERLLAVYREYLELGGLFNPGLMDHEKVRDLLMAFAAKVRELQAEQKRTALHAADGASTLRALIASGLITDESIRLDVLRTQERISEYLSAHQPAKEGK